MQLQYLLGYHSGINNPPFLLLYEVTLLGNSLQTIRENVSCQFSKYQNVSANFSR